MALLVIKHSKLVMWCGCLVGCNNNNKVVIHETTSNKPIIDDRPGSSLRDVPVTP